MKFYIPIHIVKGLLKVAPKEDVRTYLISIHVDPAAHRAEATDGSCALVIRDERIAIEANESETVPAKPVTIPRGVFEQALKGISKRDLDGAFHVSVTGEGEDSRVAITRADGATFRDSLHANFPSIERAAPAELGGAPAAMDYRLVARVVEAMRVAYAGRLLVPQLTFSAGACGPAVLTDPVAPGAFGLVMPYRAPLREGAEVEAAIKAIYDPTDAPRSACAS